MSILASFIVPHPPLIVPEVGRGKEKEIQKTIDSYDAAAKEIAAFAPETIIIISPHSDLYADYIHVSGGESARGTLRQFGAAREYHANYDSGLVEEISRLCGESGFPAGTLGGKGGGLDHGTLIPMHFIEKYHTGYKLVRVSISGLSRQEHYRFGMILNEAVEGCGRKTVIVASGDLSHKLKEDGPYGFATEGPELDARLVEIMRSGDFGGFFDLDAGLCENAAECGLSGFIIMAGALNKKSVEPRFLSYEDTFGVGYAVSIFTVNGQDPERDFLERAKEKHALRIRNIRENEDLYVRLARRTLELYVRTGEIPAAPDMPEEMLTRRAGVFVSIKKHGQLRGCIGTISPVRQDIAQEIIFNAISSGTEDPRFSPVRPEELDSLEYSVDILSPAEKIPDKSGLDVSRYGVIVSKGHKRGLLLPNLEGVNTIDEQLRFACQKAGIGAHESYEIERFEVVRHK